jgi:hypothetical protein
MSVRHISFEYTSSLYLGGYSCPAHLSVAISALIVTPSSDAFRAPDPKQTSKAPRRGIAVLFQGVVTPLGLAKGRALAAIAPVTLRVTSQLLLNHRNLVSLPT